MSASTPRKIMSPLKNTDKYLSDFLPPALVKDWRQCFRSRSSVALFILLEVAGWFIFACMVADADQSPSQYLRHLNSLGGMLYALGVFALCLIIPFRAGSTVAADTRVRSSNFLMLTPLSTRRIVWGTWSSTALIVLLAALLALPLLVARRAMMAAYPQIGEFNLAALNWEGVAVDTLMLFWLVLAGWVMAGFYMFSSALPRILRVLLLIFFGILATEFLTEHTLAGIFGLRDPNNEGMTQLPELFPLGLHVLDALLLLLLFLELSRRHYAAPAENCSRSVRLLAPLPMLVYGLLLLLAGSGWQPVDPDGQLAFALIYLFVALLSDALLPCYPMPAHAYRFWRMVPGWLQKPGFVPSTLCLAFACLFCCLPEVAHAWDGGEPDLVRLYRGGYIAMNVGFSLMLWLFITDCFCRRNAAKRPLVFGVVALACFLAAQVVKIPLEDMEPVWCSSLPLVGVDAPFSSSMVTAATVSAGGFLLLLLLLLWRGRKDRR